MELQRWPCTVVLLFQLLTPLMMMSDVDTSDLTLLVIGAHDFSLPPVQNNACFASGIATCIVACATGRTMSSLCHIACGVRAATVCDSATMVVLLLAAIVNVDVTAAKNDAEQQWVPAEDGALAAALDRAASVDGHVTINLRPGRHRVSAPLRFNR